MNFQQSNLRGHGHDSGIAEVVLHQAVADRHLHQALLVLRLTKENQPSDQVFLLINTLSLFFTRPLEIFVVRITINIIFIVANKPCFCLILYLPAGHLGLGHLLLLLRLLDALESNPQLV